MPTQLISRSIFKAYDIRGIIGKTLDAQVAFVIGQAFGAAIIAKGETSAVIGRDGRLSGPDLCRALARGLQLSGVNVIDLGVVATPMLYFSTHALTAHSGVMVTGSHNPPEYNGFKLVLAGEAIYGDAIQSLYNTIIQKPFPYGGGRESDDNSSNNSGSYTQHDIRPAYLKRIISDITLARPMHIAVDCGNGVAGAFAGDLYKGLGCITDELFCEVDGTFPNHHPDPALPENLRDLIRHVQTGAAEIGLAFDGDGDRLGVVTKGGNIIYPDRQLMLFVKDVLTRHPGAPIIYDVKCSGHMTEWIKEHGGVPLMWKTGHSLVKAKLRETGSPLGGEMSGHIFFQDRWYGFDDGLYAGARMLELLSRVADPSALLNALPQSISTPELQISREQGDSAAIIRQIQESDHVAAFFPNAQEIIRIDGLRIDYADGFGLARASNTTPVIMMRFEAETADALIRIQADFKNAILAVKADVIFPF